MKISQISFHRLETPAERPYGSPGLGSKYQGQSEPTPLAFITFGRQFRQTPLMSMPSIPVRIENRAQLIYLLNEAAELEHGIMCCYLFTAFSIKSETSKKASPKCSYVSVRRWRKTILQVAVEALVHMYPGLQDSYTDGGWCSSSSATKCSSRKPKGLPAVL